MINWQKKYLDNCKDNIDRAELCTRIDIEPEFLTMICEDDKDPFVVKFAALNPLTSEISVELALTRFPQLNNSDFWDRRNRNIQQFEVGKINQTQGRDQILLEHIKLHDNTDHVSAHLGKPIPKIKHKVKKIKKKWDPTKKYRIAMIMAPAWGVAFPPYATAKLTAILRKFEYSVKVFDLNVECFHLLKENNPDINYWDSNYYYVWINNRDFYHRVLPIIKPLLDSTVDEIINSSVKVVGFSVYNTNFWATSYIIFELKKRNPDIFIMVGGPEIMTSKIDHRLYANYYFVGESEENFIFILENLPESIPNKQVVGSTDSKLLLEGYPYADYSDYNLENYEHRYGVSIETSRGCVAKCSFCAETHFWKFRSLTPERVIEEMKYQIQTHKVRRFWFVDSLVNGNLKNFQKLVDLINENNLKIWWNSYARCDGRMTSEFLKNVAKSGCTALSYGVESGSQKVLLDMRKKIEIWEIEQNLKDTVEADIEVHVNWMIGFPTEDPIDFIHSLTLLFNNRNYIDTISPGFGTGIPNQTDMETNAHLYGILPITETTFFGQWCTDNFKNTILNRFIRFKFTHIWLEILNDINSRIENTQRYGDLKNFYKLDYNKNLIKNYINYENYVNVLRSNEQELKDNIANEFYAFMYIFWKCFQQGKFEIIFDPTKDIETFGTFLANNYKATVSFSVNINGDYEINGNHTFIHESITGDKIKIISKEKEIRDHSFVHIFKESGNFKDWIEEKSQIKETVHENYRKKNIYMIEST